MGKLLKGVSKITAEVDALTPNLNGECDNDVEKDTPEKSVNMKVDVEEADQITTEVDTVASNILLCNKGPEDQKVANEVTEKNTVKVEALSLNPNI